MKNKIKITEEQLNFLLKKKNVNEELNIEELGGPFHYDSMGKFKEGEGPMPDPLEMAEIVAKQIKIHPDFFKDENAGALYEFFDHLKEILTIKNEADIYFPDEFKTNYPKVSDDQLNENNEVSINKIKSEFKRFL